MELFKGGLAYDNHKVRRFTPVCVGGTGYGLVN
jgi:hypothetical protein